MQNQLGTELAGLSVEKKGTGCGVTRSRGVGITCCVVGAAFLPELQLLLEPPSSHSRESLGYLQPPRTAVLAEWASLDGKINPRGNAAEQEGI